MEALVFIQPSYFVFSDFFFVERFFFSPSALFFPLDLILSPFYSFSSTEYVFTQKNYNCSSFRFFEYLKLKPKLSLYVRDKSASCRAILRMFQETHATCQLKQFESLTCFSSFSAVYYIIITHFLLVTLDEILKTTTCLPCRKVSKKQFLSHNILFRGATASSLYVSHLSSLITRMQQVLSIADCSVGKSKTENDSLTREGPFNTSPLRHSRPLLYQLLSKHFPLR